MTRDDIVLRARSAIGLRTIYGLGAGAPFQAPTPKDEHGACDCSGFSCWVLGIARYQPSFSWLVKFNGGWVNTDGMYDDAKFETTGFFAEVWGGEPPLPGNLIVYPGVHYAAKLYPDGIPGSVQPTIGHVGILTSDSSVVHCSSGNYHRSGDAIQETDLAVFIRVAYHTIISFAGAE